MTEKLLDCPDIVASFIRSKIARTSCLVRTTGSLSGLRARTAISRLRSSIFNTSRQRNRIADRACADEMRDRVFYLPIESAAGRNENLIGSGFGANVFPGSVEAGKRSTLAAPKSPDADEHFGPGVFQESHDLFPFVWSIEGFRLGCRRLVCCFRVIDRICSAFF